MFSTWFLWMLKCTNKSIAVQESHRAPRSNYWCTEWETQLQPLLHSPAVCILSAFRLLAMLHNCHSSPKHLRSLTAWSNSFLRGAPVSQPSTWVRQNQCWGKHDKLMCCSIAHGPHLSWGILFVSADLQLTLQCEGVRCETYSSSTRNFAVSLHLFSAKAYEFMKRTFQLPESATLHT